MAFKQYNITGITDNSTNGIVSIMQQTSLQTSYIPGILLNLAIFIVIFLTLKMKGYSTVNVIASTCFVNIILGLLMFALHLIPGWYLVLIIVVFPASLLMLWLGGDSF